jgi:hypothetical protein
MTRLCRKPRVKGRLSNQLMMDCLPIRQVKKLRMAGGCGGLRLSEVVPTCRLKCVDFAFGHDQLYAL